MTIKKLFTIVLFVGGIMLFSSCSNNKKKARVNANSFLTLYFQTDYESAAALCTPELGDELRESMKSIESVEAGVKEMIIKQTSQIKTEIITLEELSRDSLVVNYKVILPSFPNGIENKMVLVKREKKWLVSGFGQSVSHELIDQKTDN
ncbi:MAG: hypothetical protein WCR71_04545 [Bacteroidales bacterium]